MVDTPHLARLCPLHRAHYRRWKGHRYDPVTGDRWPGDPNVFFNVGSGGTNGPRFSETVAREWDRKNNSLMHAIVADCLAGNGCAETPNILEWCPTGARTWQAEADGLRFVVDGSTSASYPDAGHGAGSVAVEIYGPHGNTVSLTWHPHPRMARRSAHEYWEQHRDQGKQTTK